MERRSFLKTAVLCASVVGLGRAISAKEKTYPIKVDPKLFDSINRVKDPSNKTPLEKNTHR